MTFEEIRQALFELNRVHDTLRSTEKFRKGIREGETPSPRISTHIIQGINPEHLTWDDLRRAVADLEERIVGETGFGVAYFQYPGMEGEAGSYVLVPKNEGWLAAKRAGNVPKKQE
jgi:hypothetical protein